MDHFTQILRWLAGPLVGVVIGIITNYIAVKMLFRPRREHRIFGRRIPFTPGIIPRRQAALARAMGRAVGESLVRQEDLCRVFFSEDVVNVIVNKALELPEFQTMGERIFPDEYAAKREKILTFAEEKILAGVMELDPVGLVIAEGSAAIKNYAAGNPLLRMFVSDGLIASLTAPIGEKLEEFIGTTGREKLREKLDGELTVLEQKTPADLLGGKETLAELVRRAYTSFFGAFAADLAAQFHIAEIVEEKINAMPPEDLEALMLSVMKKELNAIIWLGGVIGFVLGLFNTLIGVL